MFNRFIRNIKVCFLICCVHVVLSSVINRVLKCSINNPSQHLILVITLTTAAGVFIIIISDNFGVIFMFYPPKLERSHWDVGQLNVVCSGVLLLLLQASPT